MKLRIIEKTYIDKTQQVVSYFKIQSFHDISFYNSRGYWHRISSDKHPDSNQTYYYSLQEAEDAMVKVIENIKNPKEKERVCKEYSI